MNRREIEHCVNATILNPKFNFCVVGDNRVGKTTLIESIAEKYPIKVAIIDDYDAAGIRSSLPMLRPSPSTLIFEDLQIIFAKKYEQKKAVIGLIAQITDHNQIKRKGKHIDMSYFKDKQGAIVLDTAPNIITAGTDIHLNTFAQLGEIPPTPDYLTRFAHGKLDREPYDKDKEYEFQAKDIRFEWDKTIDEKKESDFFTQMLQLDKEKLVTYQIQILANMFVGLRHSGLQQIEAYRVTKEIFFYYPPPISNGDFSQKEYDARFHR